MAQTQYPVEAVPATVSRWDRMARVFAPPCVLGTPALNPYGLTVAGLTLTIGRGTAGVAEAWVRSFFHVLDADDWVLAVPPNTNATQSRVDRIVARLSLGTELVRLAHVPGDPAASPVAKDLTRTSTVWELPLWRFTVPPASGSPATGLIDDRQFYDTDSGGGVFTPVFNTGWTGDLRYSKAPNGSVLIAGSATYSGTQTNANTPPIFNLPVGFRPPANTSIPGYWTRSNTNPAVGTQNFAVSSGGDVSGQPITTSGTTATTALNGSFFTT